MSWFNGVRNFVSDLGYTFSNGAIGNKGYLGSLFDQLSGKTAEEQYNKNYNFQRDQYEYQKALNEETMRREDTAYQRASADMYAAGLNPISGVNPANASSLTGSVGSPGSTSSSSAASLSDIASIVLGFGEQAMAKRIANDKLTEDKRHNGEMEKIAMANAGTFGRNAETNAKNAETNAKNAETNAVVGSSTARSNNAHAAATEYDTEYWKSVGASSSSSSDFKTVRESVRAAKDVVEAAADMTEDSKSRNLFSDILRDERSDFAQGAFNHWYESNVKSSERSAEQRALSWSTWMNMKPEQRVQAFYDWQNDLHGKKSNMRYKK